MKKYYIFLCTVSILLTGCSGYGDEFPAATGTSEASPNLRTEQTTSASSAIVTPMPTPQHATATPVVTAISSAATQDTRLKTECLEILPDVPRDLNGVLVLEGSSYHSPSYLLDLSSTREIQLPQKNNEAVWDSRVSPDGEWLAYLKHNASKSNAPQLIITKSDGEPRYTLTLKKPVNGIIGWLDSQRLFLVDYSLDPLGPLDPLIMFDPFTEQQWELLPDYPEIYYAYPP